MLGEVNQNGRRNGSYYHSVEAGYEIASEHEDVDHYLPSHCHDGNAVGGKGCHRGRLNKWALWVSVVRRPQNGASEKKLAKKGSHLTIDMTIEDVRYVK